MEGGKGPHRVRKAPHGSGARPRRVRDGIAAALELQRSASPADRLNAANDLALGRLVDVLSVPLDYTKDAMLDPAGLAAIKLQSGRAVEAIALQVRVEEARLRATRPDALGELLQRIGEAEREREAPLPVIEVSDEPNK